VLRKSAATAIRPPDAPRVPLPTKQATDVLLLPREVADGQGLYDDSVVTLVKELRATGASAEYQHGPGARRAVRTGEGGSGSSPCFPLLRLSFSPIFPLLAGPRSENPCKPRPRMSAAGQPWPGESPVLAGHVRPIEPVVQNGRYWARTSDLRLVEAALSQLS
jgi:hypothetical protein